jgi:hypothetical protein
MDPDEKEVLNTLMAQVDALELVLKMVISVQLADHVVVHAGDPKNQSAIDAVARAFRERVLETVSTAAAKFPDKKVANFVEGIAKETVSRLYDDAAKQVSQTTARNFGRGPS